MRGALPQIQIRGVKSENVSWHIIRTFVYAAFCFKKCLTVNNAATVLKLQ